jgi:crotonobetainyl-CoA:carnitine CoA-transferase CaiB-like acyl-CoA transferase
MSVTGAPMEALAGCRVLELGSTVAGPFCGRLLADFGAEVVKVEPPAGDPVRTMGKHVGDTSLYAASIFRNKSLIAVDLGTPGGRDVIRRLVVGFDVVIENFRPGTLERWGLAYDDLRAINPRIIMLRISGFGQDGPYRERPGYGFLGDAVSGLLGITGFPDRQPVRAPVPVTDMLTALYGAFGIATALLVRERTGLGQSIDAALYESSFSMMESHVPAYDKLGVSPPRSGSRLPGSTPNNLYPTRDDHVVAIAAASDSVFKRLAEVIGRADLAVDPRFKEARTRTKNEDAVDEAISAWTRTHDLVEIEELLRGADVPASRVFTLEDIFDDPHYRAREMLVSVPDAELGTIAMIAPVPKLSGTPARIKWAGRRTGEDTDRVLRELGDFTDAELARLEAAGAIRRNAADTGHREKRDADPVHSV